MSFISCAIIFVPRSSKHVNLQYDEEAKSIMYSCYAEVEVKGLHMNYEWYEKRFWRSEHTVGMPCVCFMDSVNKGLPTEMQQI